MSRETKELSPAGYGFRARLLLFIAIAFLATVAAYGLSAKNASAAIYSTINFQGKVVNTNGTNIADGTYNMQFKLYTGGDGVVGGGDETLQWTEERLRNNSQGVLITDGIFQVNLGSVTALPDIFNNNIVWLSMNVGNTNATCTPFSNCVPDGEMSPMIRLTAAPYALNSDKLGGLSATNFVQLAQGLQTDASATQASIAINKTGATANILTLQRAGADVLAIDTNGVSTFSDDVTLTLAETEDLAVDISISGTNSGQGQAITLTNSTSSGNQYGLTMTNADHANNAVTEALISLSNAEGAANTLTDGLIISGTAGAGLDTIVDAIDVSDDNITNAINIGTNFLVASGDSINDFTGNAGLVVSSSALTIDVTSTGTTATTSSNSGLEIGSDGLRLLGGCTSGTSDILKWNGTNWACAADNSGGSPTWDTIGDPAGNGAINFGETVQTLDFTITSANASLFSFNFTNNGGTAGTDSGLVINNAVSANSTGDINTENLLLIQQLDTTTSGTTAVDNALKIDSAGSSSITDAIEITNSAGNITNGINIIDTAGGTITTGLNFSGTFTQEISLANGLTVSNVDNNDLNLVENGLTLNIDFGEATASTISYLSSSALIFDSTGSTLILGTSTNGLTFNSSTKEPSLSGTARHTRKVNLVPEYPGAVLTGDGAGNTGTMTSDFCGNDGAGSFADINTAVCASGDFHNYYTWTHTAAADYDVWVRWQVPSDFDGFASSTSIQMFGWRTDATATTEVQLSLWENGTQCGTTTNVATGTAVWTETAMTGDETTCSGITAGDVVFFKIHMEVAANKTVRAGEIRFDYLSKW